MDVQESWPPTELDRDEAERRDAVFRLRLWTWLVRKNGRPPLVVLQPRRRRRFRFIVTCRRCWRLVTMPTKVGPAEHERMRLHLGLHLGRDPLMPEPADELLRHFDVKPRR